MKLDKKIRGLINFFPMTRPWMEHWKTNLSKTEKHLLLVPGIIHLAAAQLRAFKPEGNSAASLFCYFARISHNSSI